MRHLAKEDSMRRLRLLVTGLLFAMLALLPAQATIVDDIDTVGSAVNADLVNQDPVADRGYVEVIADVGGPKPETQRVPYDIDANGNLTVTLNFSSTVVTVLETRIVDSAEPF
jgi:hypothetical protein